MTEPELIMGTRPDGSPWVISAEFDRADVRVDGYGVLRLAGKAIAPALARKRALALLAAVEWIENDRSAQVEAEAQK
jgi:hypothetical protein